MTSAMNAVVTVKSIKVFGDSKEYPADEVTMKKFVKWARRWEAPRDAQPGRGMPVLFWEQVKHQRRGENPT